MAAGKHTDKRPRIRHYRGRYNSLPEPPAVATTFPPNRKR
jgi:hypothetical protein